MGAPRNLFTETKEYCPNAHSPRKKMVELKKMVDTENLDVIVTSETQLTSDVYGGKIQLLSFLLGRSDRLNWDMWTGVLQDEM